MTKHEGWRSVEALLAMKADFLAMISDMQLKRGSSGHDTMQVDAVTGKEEYVWVIRERLRLLLEINIYRDQAGLPLVQEKELYATEQRAFGRADYSDKLALYCAELAMGPDSLRRAHLGPGSDDKFAKKTREAVNSYWGRVVKHPLQHVGFLRWLAGKSQKKKVRSELL